MDAVFLNGAGNGVHVGVELGNQRDVEFVRREMKALIELLPVAQA